MRKQKRSRALCKGPAASDQCLEQLAAEGTINPAQHARVCSLALLLNSAPENLLTADQYDSTDSYRPC